MPPPYQPVGRCIYCRTTEYSIDRKKLSEEHIIPFCLDGEHVLPEASCKKCEGKTGGVEQALFGDSGHFRATRVHAGSGSRDKKKPKTVPVWLGEPPNQVRYDMAPTEGPRFVMLAHFPEPNVLRGGSPADMAPENTQLFLTDLEQGAKGYPSAPVSPPGLDLVKLGRFLAKIGHSFAVAELGVDGFKPMLADAIRGIGPMPWGLIGSVSDKRQLLAERYAISLHTENVGDSTYVVVDVRLFGPVPFPWYRVVVGTIEGEPDNAVEGANVVDA